MAGKTKKQEKDSSAHGKPKSPMTPKGLMDGPLKGHLGLKSSPFAPTDCKLVSQYMVLDHMTSHYKKLNNVKACVDTSTPKAWLVSQKVRDRARREAMKNEVQRCDAWLSSQKNTPRASSRASSDIAREEMLVMMQGLTAADGLDEVDYAQIRANIKAERRRQPDAAGSVTDIEVHVSESDSQQQIDAKDMRLVDRIVSDSTQSPSFYHRHKHMPSNIPPNTGKYTPRSNDLLDSHSHKYTEEKPFTPRTLKSDRVSKLSQFKYYTPPKRKPKPSAEAPTRPNVHHRPETPITETSMDIMLNETLMSRDFNHTRSPSGVPPLDISLDADHLKWLKEQTRRGQLRSTRSIRTRSDAGSELGSFKMPADMKKDLMEADPQYNAGVYSFTGGVDSTLTKTATMMRISNEEEELKYLEFITDVTNDVLDRGIFTNRVLKSVFEAHIEKRKHELKISKMREMVEDLRRDLGIPYEDCDSNNLGLGSNQAWTSEEMATMTRPIEQNQEDSYMVSSARAARRRWVNADPLMTTQKQGLPTLRPSKRGHGGEGKPPLPRPGSRGSRSRPGSSCSRTDLQDVKEVSEEHDIFAANQQPNHPLTNGVSADILKIEHDDQHTESMQNEFASELNGLPEDPDSKTEVENTEVEPQESSMMEDTMKFDSDLQDTLKAQLEDYEAHSLSEDEDKGEENTEAGGDQQEVESVEIVSPLPRPQPRRRSTLTPRSDVKETPRSGEITHTSDSIDISELDDNDLSY